MAIERSQLPWEIFAGLFAGKGEPFAVESEAARGPSALRAERRSPDVVGAEAGAAGGPAKSGVVNHYGPSNEGPLPEKIANTFRSGTYDEVTTTEPTKLYRVYGGSAGEMGAYWTRTKPSGPVQSISDCALLPQWGNNATSVVEIEVPIGTKFYEGVAAPQERLVGGGNQVFFDTKVDPSWKVNQ